MTTTQQLDSVRNTPAFATLSAEDQYDTQRNIILQGLMGVPEFQALPNEQKLSVYKDSIKQGVDFVYENPEMAQMVNDTTAKILSGDQEAFKAAKGYVMGSYTTEKMPMFYRIGMRGANWLSNADKNGDAIWGVPGEYYSSGMNTVKTKGADDNKARAELTATIGQIDPAFQEEMRSHTNRSKALGIAGAIGQGINVGAVFNQMAPLVTGVGTGAKAASSAGGALRTGAQNLVRQLPNIGVEAGLEGTFGIVEALTDAAQRGETLTGGEVAGNFALYAGGDIAFNALANTVGPILKYAFSPWSKRVKNATKVKLRYDDKQILEMADQLRRGEIPVELTQLTDQPALADHLQTVKRYWEIDAKVHSKQDLEQLSEIDRTLYDGMELGYDVIPLENGKVRIRPNGDLEKSWEFENIYDAKEGIGSHIKIEDLEKMDIKEPGEFFAQKSGIINYGLIPQSLDNHATIRAKLPDVVSSNFRKAGTRQFITPSEADNITGGFTPGRIVRFQVDDITPKVKSRKITQPDGKVKVEKYIESPITRADTPEVSFRADQANESGNILVHAHSPASPEDVAKAREYSEFLINREGLNASIERITRDKLIERGFDSSIDAEGNLNHFFPDRVKIVSDYVDPRTGKVGESAYNKALKTKTKGIPEVEVKAKGNVTAKARRIGNDPAAFSRLANKVLAGETTPEGIEGLSRAYAGRMGGSGLKSTMNVTVKPELDTVKLYKKGNQLYIDAPAIIDSPQKARKVFNDLTLGLEKQYPVNGSKARKSYTDAFRKTQSQFTLPMVNPAIRESWVKGLSELNGTPVAKNAGWYAVKLKDGNTVKSRDLNIIARNLVIDYTDPDLLKYDMLAQGLKLEKLADNSYKMSTVGGNEIATGAYKQVLDAAGYSPSKLPASLGPQLIVENKIPSLAMKIEGPEIVGNKQQVDEYMSMYEDYNKLLQSSGADIRKSGEAMIKHSHMNYEVRVPQIGYAETFDNAVDAKKFFNGGWQELDSLQKASLKKGARLSYNGGKWNLQTPDGKTYLSANSEELYDSLAKLRSPTFEKDYMPDDLNAYMKSIGKRTDLIPGDFSTPMDGVDAIPKYDIGSSNEHIKKVFDDIRPANKIIREHFKRSADPKGAELFENLLNGVDAWGADARPYDDVINRIFRDSKGKLISKPRREGISAILEARTPDLEKAAFATPEFTLKEEDWGRVAKMRDLWNTLGTKAQFDQKIFLQDYVPNVRKKVNGSGPMEKTEVLSKDYLAGTFQNGQNVPRELKMVYRLERTSDMARVIRNTDAMDLALTYNKIIHRDLYLNKPWKDLYGHLNETIKTKNANPALIEQLNLFRERLMSPQLSANQRAIDDQMKKFLSKVGVDAETSRDVLGWFTTAHYRTAMAFRPWLPFRNLWQTHVILPLKTGSIRPVNRAMRQFVRNPEVVIDEMLKRGVAQEGDSLIESLRTFHKVKTGKPEGAIDKFFSWGMSPFGRSDMITRGVAWLSAKDLLGQGMEAYRKSGNIKDLIKKSRLEVFHDSIQAQTLKYIEAGQYEAAESYFGRQMVRSTMFDYRAINRPLVQKGFVGKLAMQYGTHPINAMETFREALSYGSLGAKAKGLIAGGASTLALGAAFKALGINNTNFLLWNQPLFTGGPGLKLLSSAPMLMDKSYRGDQARRDFSRTFLPVSYDKQSEQLALQWPQIMPGFYQAYYWGEGMKYLEQGKLWEASLSFLTVPIDKDRRNLIYEETGGQAGSR